MTNFTRIMTQTIISIWILNTVNNVRIKRQDYVHAMTVLLVKVLVWATIHHSWHNIVPYHCFHSKNISDKLAFRVTDKLRFGPNQHICITPYAGHSSASNLNAFNSKYFIHQAQSDTACSTGKTVTLLCYYLHYAAVPLNVIHPYI